jgi:hypothetical protein
VTPEREDKFRKLFPGLFADDQVGFSCEDGWYALIMQLTHDIWEIVKDLPVADRPTVVQVKEKLGGLRYYMVGVHDSVAPEVYKLVRQAEEESYRTCERCGRPGELRRFAWLRTLCTECAVASKLERSRGKST